MSRRLKTYIAYILSAIIFAGSAPAAVFAANNEYVLTSINHSSVLSSVDASGKTAAVLTVPYTSAGSLDLSQGLDITFNTSIYSSAIPTFPDGATATVDGDPVRMVVTYEKKGSDKLYTTTYTLGVERADFASPGFRGSLTKTATLSQPLVFTLQDFASKYVRNDGGEFAGVVITGANPSFGSLRLGSTVYSPGTRIAASDLGSSRLTFVATGAGTVSYIVQAYAAGAVDVLVGSVVLTVSAEQTPAAFQGTIEKIVPISSASIVLSFADFASKYSKNDGHDLSRITLTGGSSGVGRLTLGTWDYVSGSSVDVSDLAGGKLSFVVTGEGAATYIVKAYGKEDTAPVSGSVTLKIVVEKGKAGNIAYALEQGTALQLDASDLNEACVSLLGRNLSYVKFDLPSSSQGTLYYDYQSSGATGSKVSASTKYYRGSTPSVGQVFFVPRSGFVGNATIAYTGYDSSDVSFTGTITVVVRARTTALNLEYSTASKNPVAFKASDFNSVCTDLTGKSLSWVRFDSPVTSAWILRYDYWSTSEEGEVVDSSTRYYRNSTPSISRVTFVPRPGYSGVASLPYTGCNADGVTFTGVVRVTVMLSARDLLFTAGNDEPVTFGSGLFDEVSRELTGYPMRSVQFTLPSASQGTLYYDYVSEKNLGTKVGGNTRYYRDASPYVARVTFVPKSGYSGTVSIAYTGTSADGQSYSGVIKVTVLKKEGSKHFGDVDKHFWWCSSAIDYLYKKGVCTGVGGNLYKPSNNITRGDFILMLCRAFGLVVSGSHGNFTDVDKSSYYYDAVSTAKALGIAKGDGNRFSPDSYLTRQDAMVLIARAMEHSFKPGLASGNASDLSAFSDRGQVDSYATSAVACLVRAGVVQGSGGQINPKGSVSRGEMAVMVYRIIGSN